MRETELGRRARGGVYLAAASALAVASASHAGETQTYVYDALGRLVKVQHSGTVNGNRADSLCYDPAGNRTQYKSDAAGGVASCGGGGGGTPPPPPPPNQPPVANPDFLTAPKCVVRQVNVIANDTDPDGHYPLTLSAVNQPWASVLNGTTIALTTPETNGSYAVTYTVTDSLGATANGILTVTVSGSQQCV